MQNDVSMCEIANRVIPQPPVPSTTTVVFTANIESALQKPVTAVPGFLMRPQAVLPESLYTVSISYGTCLADHSYNGQL